MKQLIIFIAVVLTLSSCNNDENEVVLNEEIPGYVGKYGAYEGCDEGDCSYKVIKNATLEEDFQEYRTNVIIVDGSNVVFSFQYDYDDEPMIADDELTEFVYFEVSKALLGTIEGTYFPAFSLTAQEANAYFGFICYCAEGPFLKVSEGSISGQQLSANLWSIDVNIIVEGKYYPKRELQYSAIYQAN